MMSRTLKILSMVVLAALSLCCPVRAGLRLASEGKSDYVVVKPDRATPNEEAAATDLAHYLKLITGADLPILTAAEAAGRGNGAKFLYIGRRAPSDARPFAEWERRIRSENGDVYFYGRDRRDGVFAVYDFLEEYFGCRWFSLRGNEKIPTKREAELPPIDFSRIPSFPIQMYGQNRAIELSKAYERRNRVFILQRSTPMLITGHVPDMMVPPGGKHANKIWKPFPLFKDEAWFETHPEYFSLDPEGKRVSGVQLCYYNPELRKLLNEKYDQIIRNCRKDDGPALVKCNLNDNWGFKGKTLCCCPGCMALVKKYDDPAGPYWDYMIELCGFLKERHPDITVEGSTYQISAEVPKCIRRLPDNLMIGYAPLWHNYLKPFDHPSNAPLQEKLKSSLEKFRKVRVQIYPTVYPRDTTIQPLIADLRQLGRTLRYLKKQGVVELTAELGYTWQCETAFSDLRYYLLSRLANNVELDVDELVVEYMEHTYRKAAPKMIAYWRELEQCEAEETVGLMWTGLPYGAYRYLNAANLSRWTKEFDAMEELVKDDTEALAAVKSARVNLDEAILSVWPRLPKRREFDLDTVLTRVRKNIAAATERVTAFETDPDKRKKLFDNLYARRVLNGVDFFEFAARKPKALRIRRPLRPGAVHRQIPTHRRYTEFNVRAYSDDPKAPFGVSMWFNLRTKAEIPTPKLRLCAVGGSDRFVAMKNTRVLRRDEIQKNVGKGFRLYYIGRTRLYPQCVLWLGGVRLSMNAQLSHFFDPRHPEQEYDVYLSIRARAKPVSAYLGEVVLIKCDGHSPGEAAPDTAATAEPGPERKKSGKSRK